MHPAYEALKERVEELQRERDMTAQSLNASLRRCTSIDWKTLRQQERENNPNFDSKRWKEVLIARLWPGLAEGCTHFRSSSPHPRSLPPWW